LSEEIQEWKVERIKFRQTLNARLVVGKAKVEDRRVRCQESDNDIANVEGGSEDNSRRFTRRSK
jgi:hypothetical protein